MTDESSREDAHSPRPTLNSARVVPARVVSFKRRQIDSQIPRVLPDEKTNTDMLERFQSMIAEYNAGSATIEQLFQ